MLEMKIFNIGKANAEIEKLQKDLEAAQAESKTLKENIATIEAAAESEKDRADKASKEADSLRSQIKELTDAKAKAEADALKIKTDFEAKEKNLAAEVEKQASAKALQITAGQGQPPIVAAPAANPAKPETKSDLKGLDLVRSSFEAQVKAFNSTHQ